MLSGWTEAPCEAVWTWGTRTLVESLRAAGIEVVHEEFEDSHRDTGDRYERSLAYLVPRVAR